MESIRISAVAQCPDPITAISRALSIAKAGKINIDLTIGQVKITVRQDSCDLDLFEIYRLKSNEINHNSKE